MARSSMAALITRLRRLVSDPAGASQTWDDNQLQDVLDEHRCDHRYERLCQEETYAAGTGVVTYLTYQAEAGEWESDAALTDNTYTPVTPTTSDYLRGRWTFTTEPNWPLFITGRTYDLYGAAADVLEAWAAKVKCQVDFSAEGMSTKLSQYGDRLLQLAATYRQKQRPQQGHLSRSDIAGSRR